MITSEIIDLVQYIISQGKCNAEFGDRDIGSNEYPFVKVKMVDDFQLFRGTEKFLTTDLPLELRIIVSKGNELKALEVLERLYLKMNQFNPQKGNEFEGTGTPEYVDETQTFEISLPYKLKLTIQDN